MKVRFSTVAYGVAPKLPVVEISIDAMPETVVWKPQKSLALAIVRVNDWVLESFRVTRIEMSPARKLKLMSVAKKLPATPLTPPTARNDRVMVLLPLFVDSTRELATLPKKNPPVAAALQPTLPAVPPTPLAWKPYEKPLNVSTPMIELPGMPVHDA